ncbi:MAG: leucine-rich repeat domain-containing protein [Clostridiales bacterium]|nr:leucine-rich repeat domain-containing protein [Clostridiales bacterium]
MGVQLRSLTGAFYGCSSLTEIVIPEGVTSIGDGAFRGCTSLTSVVIPERVTSIGGYAFYGCSSLTEIVIPEGVTNIGDYAVYGCTNLTIYCEAEEKPSGWNINWNSSNSPVVWGYKGEE